MKVLCKRLFLSLFFILFILIWQGIIVFAQTEPTDGPKEESTEWVCLYHGEHGEGDKEHKNLFNLVANALSYGIITNGIRNGSGTEDPVALSHGRALPKAEGPYFQGTRLLSLIDWELGRGLYFDQDRRPLPPQILALLGPMTKEDQLKLQEKGLEEIQVELPFSPPLPLAPLPSTFKIKMIPGSLESTKKEEWKGALFSGLAKEIAKRAEDPQIKTPVMAASLDWVIPENGPDSLLEMDVFIPVEPIPVLNKDKEKGFARRPIPGGDVVTVLATLNDISYLQAPEPEKDVHHLIQVKVQKSFSEHERRKLNLIMTFGRLNQEKTGLDHSHPEDALALYGKFFIPHRDRDSLITRKMKTWFNNRMAPFELEAKFHQIGLELTRKGENTWEEEALQDHPMRPSRFIQNETHISYRIWRRKVHPSQMGRLRAMGFICKVDEQVCYQDFSTWKQMETRLLGGFFQKSVIRMVGKMTNWDLVKSLPDLQEEADKDLAERLDEVLDTALGLKQVLLKVLLGK